MSVTNQNQENDTLKVEYNEETGEIQLQWDPEDANWKWLNDLTQDQIRDMIMSNIQQYTDEHFEQSI